MKSPQPISAPAGKVEVIEFFWYGCPHCYEFEPTLEAWVKKQGDNIVFKRVPVAFRDDFLPHSKMYYALYALGLAEKVTPAVFNAIHKQKNYLLTPQAQADFLATQGVDKKKYMDAYNSFTVQGAGQAVGRTGQDLRDRRRADHRDPGQVQDGPGLHGQRGRHAAGARLHRPAGPGQEAVIPTPEAPA